MHYIRKRFPLKNISCFNGHLYYVSTMSVYNGIMHYCGRVFGSIYHSSAIADSCGMKIKGHHKMPKLKFDEVHCCTEQQLVKERIRNLKISFELNSNIKSTGPVVLASLFLYSYM